jgi:hypothetical protein
MNLYDAHTQHYSLHNVLSGWPDQAIPEDNNGGNFNAFLEGWAHGTCIPL